MRKVFLLLILFIGIIGCRSTQITKQTDIQNVQVKESEVITKDTVYYDKDTGSVIKTEKEKSVYNGITTEYVYVKSESKDKKVSFVVYIIIYFLGIFSSAGLLFGLWYKFKR